MGNNAEKRARQAANRQDSEPTTNQRGRLIATIVVLGAVLVGLAVFLFGSNSGTDGDTAAGATPCPPEGGSAARVTDFEGPPETCIDADAIDYTATFVTSEGTFTATLDAASAPATVNNFVVLARYGYYDGTPIHRVVPDFVIQGGDGDGEPLGSNDLGYTIDDELPESSDAYTDYSLAMANAGPNTNGSQFFVVLPGGGARLGPSFSRFGEVIEGTEAVDAIASLGQPGADGPPTRDVTVESVEITETPI